MRHALCWPKKVGFMRFIPVAVFLMSLTGPALAQERQWTIDASDKQAFLVFGVPDTADVGLSFWCDVGAKSMSMFVPVSVATARPGQHPKVSAIVGGRTFSFKSDVEKDQSSGLVNVEVQFDRDGPFHKAVMAADAIAVTVKSEKKSYPLGDADFAGLNRACVGEQVN
jgi:hypothetical protein